MNNYYSEINNTNKLTEYNLKDLSSKISCENMSLLSKNYTDNQRTLFDANILTTFNLIAHSAFKI